MGTKTNLQHSERSAYVRRIIGVPPHWMVQWGIVLIFAALITLVGVAYFVKYPDVVSTYITITAQNPPVPVAVSNNATVSQFFVGKGDSVRDGQEIAVVSNSATFEDIVRLDSFLKTNDTTNIKFVERFRMLPPLHVGSVESAYLNTLNLIQSFQQKEVYFVTVQNQTRAEIKSKTKEAEKKVRSETEVFQTLKQNADAIYAKFLEKQSGYINRKVSLADLHTAETEKVSAEYKRDYQKKILDDQIFVLKKLKLEEQSIGTKPAAPIMSDKEYTGLLESVTQLKKALTQWKVENYIFARTNGRFSPVQKNLSPKESPFEKDIIGYILTSSDSTYIANAAFPEKAGQIVLPNRTITLRFFPPYVAEEFVTEGIVTGKKISEKNDKNIIVEIKLLNWNSFKKKLVEKNNENTSNRIFIRADIVGEERTLLQRIFNKFL